MEAWLILLAILLLTLERGAYVWIARRPALRDISPLLCDPAGRVGRGTGDRGGRPVWRLQGRADLDLPGLVAGARGRPPRGRNGARGGRGADRGRTGAQLRRVLSSRDHRRRLRG